MMSGVDLDWLQLTTQIRASLLNPHGNRRVFEFRVFMVPPKKYAAVHRLVHGTASPWQGLEARSNENRRRSDTGFQPMDRYFTLTT
jgi:hypothetical protein